MNCHGSLHYCSASVASRLPRRDSRRSPSRLSYTNHGVRDFPQPSPFSTRFLSLPPILIFPPSPSVEPKPLLTVLASPDLTPNVTRWLCCCCCGELFITGNPHSQALVFTAPVLVHPQHDLVQPRQAGRYRMGLGHRACRSQARS